MPAPFPVHGVVHLVRPSGRVACDLVSLREGLASASTASLFYHAHHPRLRHPFSPTLPPDDFSAWVGGVLQDRETAERLAYAVQTGGATPDALRESLLAALPAAGSTGAAASVTTGEGAFAFLEMDSVRIDLGLEARDADELVAHLCEGSVALFFHHVTEVPWFGSPAPTAAAWARERGERRMAEWLEGCAHDGRPLAESRRRLVRRWQRGRMVHRVAEAAGMPEGVRQAAARRVVGSLVRRMTER